MKYKEREKAASIQPPPSWQRAQPSDCSPPCVIGKGNPVPAALMHKVIF